MAASQRLYIDVADEFDRLLKSGEHDRESIAAAARKVAEAFKRDNHRFRYDTFYDAAGLDEYGKASEEVAEQVAFPDGRDYGEPFEPGGWAGDGMK